MQTAMSGTAKKVAAGSVVTPKGFAAAGVHTKVKRKRKDLGILWCQAPAAAAAVYTANRIQAAPLTLTKEHLAKSGGYLQAIIVNSGNANACTGQQGEEDARAMSAAAADQFGIKQELIAIASTGIIGVQMPMEKILPGLIGLTPVQSDAGASAFHEAILTTDTCEKAVCYETVIGGKKVLVAGAAKGSGMIAPNMATMLGFITTDACIHPADLHSALSEAVDSTFNCITVDGDTSTNDMVIAMASGLAGNTYLNREHSDWTVFVDALRIVCEELAIMIARDGEGATKLIEANVAGALSGKEAKLVAKSIVGSSLVKTMVHGADPNWGRVMMGIGKSGAELDPGNIDISIGPYPLLQASEPVKEESNRLEEYLAGDKIEILVDLHIGEGKGKAWGCDLSYDYVRINASYRT